jgi:hypothetical protein
MTNHPYIRAYIAGVAVPTLIMPLLLVTYIVARFVFQVPVPIERGLVFPLALVPNIFGLWNMFYQRLQCSSHVNIGLHGAILPFLILPCGYVIAHTLGFVTLQQSTITWFGEITVNYGLVTAGFCVGVTIYYLVWKYVVNFFNETLGIA